MRLIQVAVGLYEDRSHLAAPQGDPDPTDLLCDPQDAVLEETMGSGQIVWRLISGHEFIVPKEARIILWFSDFDGRFLCWIRPDSDQVHYPGTKLNFHEQAPTYVDIPHVLREAELARMKDPVFSARLEVVRQIMRSQRRSQIPSRHWDDLDKVIGLTATVALYIAGRPLPALGIPDNVQGSTTIQPPQGERIDHH